MAKPEVLAEIHRGPLIESIHHGHAVICDDNGAIIEAWGNPDESVFPRSSSKMIQALPLVETGAADSRGLNDMHLALSCASHNAAEVHTGILRQWLHDLELCDTDLRCGPQMPLDRDSSEGLIREGRPPCQIHNNCSGKHVGFLTVSRHLGGGAEYVEMDHPVQKACISAFEDVTGREIIGHGIDGCSAPNFATTMHAMARAMAKFASADEAGGIRRQAMVRLRSAMIAHPELVAGKGRACTELMRACIEPVALKTGAEGFYAAIAPTRKLGISVKISDGATRAANCVMAALLARLDLLDQDHPAAKLFMNAPIRNWRGIETGTIKPSKSLLNRFSGESPP